MPATESHVASGSIPACAGEPPSGTQNPHSAWVYPRVCGGTGYPLRPVLPRAGLSPRVRGNLYRLRWRRADQGSIPACAGEPLRRPAARRHGQVYPRVCGGTPGLPRERSTRGGLSPRVRGNRPRPRAVRPGRRSIPACAGEPPQRPPIAGSARVYPRVCGGTMAYAHASRTKSGLSPRVRGNPALGAQHAPDRGSIPACAGEPRHLPDLPEPPGVYPRVCGGTRIAAWAWLFKAGLSPRVRGNHANAVAVVVGDGSIPACAGEPSRSGPPSTTSRVYPRVCGGTRSVWSRLSGAPGLSPRVRGNRRAASPPACNPGSIPACAGEPSGRLAGGARSRVYPRVCGGTSEVRIAQPRVIGLSPRVRGNPLALIGQALLDGSIPACAGEPSFFDVRDEPQGVYPRVCGGTNLRVALPPAPSGLSPRVRGNRPVRAPARALPGSIPACAGEPCQPPRGGAVDEVYPRVCGGTLHLQMPVPPIRGLSPRVRGNPDGAGNPTPKGGSIPACAGEPWSGIHPALVSGGLSPRVRGNLTPVYRSRET